MRAFWSHVIEAPAFIYAGAFFASWVAMGFGVAIVAWVTDSHHTNLNLFVEGIWASPGQFLLFLLVWPLVVYVLVADLLEDQ